MKIEVNPTQIWRDKIIEELFKPTPLYYGIYRKDRREYLKAKRRWYRDYKWTYNRVGKESGYH